MENENKRKYWFFGSKLNSFLLLILIILMVFAIRMMYKNQDYYKQNLGLNYQPNKVDQAVWFIPNETGWVLHTLNWKRYILDTGASFYYPPNYVVRTQKMERRPDTFYEEVTIVDPSSRTDTPDAIYVGIPYTGANDLVKFYDIRYDANESGIDFAISQESSNFAKYIFENIVASSFHK